MWHYSIFWALDAQFIGHSII